ncbi:MAG: hypothetical protein KGI91_14475 [Burkholderiales bacterium]|nr:hypothetical protein [Burkholderiales bacterium]MDE2078253.1 hypothetical protein [Burkholderiales bacterium]MDE2433127.1 hypothetical protein [Burkholderiales bacterium]
MSADPSQSDSSSDTTSSSSSNPFTAGLGFFQDWMKAAGSAMPGMPHAGSTSGKSGSAMGSLGAWTMPTLDPQELEKRITDLKTVQFWLEQNARMIAMTIQGLEVQRMTLSTLKGMNVSMDALRESLKARASSTSTESSAPAAEAPPTEPPEGSTAGGQGINPMQWWDTLTQQFTQLANQAAQAGVNVGSAATNTMAQAAASATAAAASAAEAVQAATKQPATKRGAAKGAAAHPPKRKSQPGGQAD